MNHTPVAPPVLIVTGYSGSGKTTLIERLLPELARHGHRVGVIKHRRHAPATGAEAKDSERFWWAGAGAVALASEERVTLTLSPERLSTVDAIAALMPVDLVLAEGYKGSAGPRLIVYGEHPESVAELATGRQVLAVVGEGGPTDWPWPHFRRDNVADVADLIVGWLRREASAGRG